MRQGIDTVAFRRWVVFAHKSPRCERISDGTGDHDFAGSVTRKLPCQRSGDQFRIFENP